MVTGRKNESKANATAHSPVGHTRNTSHRGKIDIEPATRSLHSWYLLAYLLLNTVEFEVEDSCPSVCPFPTDAATAEQWSGIAEGSRSRLGSFFTMLSWVVGIKKVDAGGYCSGDSTPVTRPNIIMKKQEARDPLDVLMSWFEMDFQFYPQNKLKYRLFVNSVFTVIGVFVKSMSFQWLSTRHTSIATGICWRLIVSWAGAIQNVDHERAVLESWEMDHIEPLNAAWRTFPSNEKKCDRKRMKIKKEVGQVESRYVQGKRCQARATSHGDELRWGRNAMEKPDQIFGNIMVIEEKEQDVE